MRRIRDINYFMSQVERDFKDVLRTEPTTKPWQVSQSQRHADELTNWTAAPGGAGPVWADVAGSAQLRTGSRVRRQVQ